MSAASLQSTMKIKEENNAIYGTASSGNGPYFHANGEKLTHYCNLTLKTEWRTFQSKSKKNYDNKMPEKNIFMIFYKGDDALIRYSNERKRKENNVINNRQLSDALPKNSF